MRYYRCEFVNVGGDEGAFLVKQNTSSMSQQMKYFFCMGSVIKKHYGGY
jgi:hypothetical protein